MQPTQWTRYQVTDDGNLVPEVTKEKRDTKAIIALITLILGTLLITTGVILQFSVPVGLIVFGALVFTVGLVLGFSKE